MKIVIFDWDDTFFPKSAIFDIKCPSDLSLIKILDSAICNLLELTMVLYDIGTIDNVYIVSNSMGNWIQKSAKTHLPKTSSFIAEHNIPIISARNLFEHEFPDDPLMWKFAVLDRILVDMSFPDITSIGDGDAERGALLKILDIYPGVIGKTIKLVDSPSILELIKQLNLISESICDIIDIESSIDIKTYKNLNNDFYYTYCS